MSARGVRIVVGEGPSTRKGLLRFVLDGEGFDVVADAATTAELARLMAIHRPDVVVLDDGIGATAVSMINEMSPDTKVVLVWPGAVMPVGGAARVEPARVLQDLGPTIARLTGQPGAALGRGAALLDQAANDPDVLQSMLRGESAEAIIEDREPAPVVILPLTPTIDHDELVLNVPEAEPDDDERTKAGRGAGVAGAAASASVLAASGPAAATEATATGAANAPAAVTSIAGRRRAPGAQSVLNRRLGNLALGGAAVASALVLALALGDARVPIDVVRGAGSSSIQTPPPGGTTGGAVPPGDLVPGPDDGMTLPGDPIDPGTAASERTFPDVALVGDVSPAPGPPDVGVDPGDIGPGDPPGGGDPPVTGGDDHGGSDAGDHDRGGGNDDPDNGGGTGTVGDDDGSTDHDSGGGNDDQGGDHDQGGGNDDDDNPAHQHGNEGGSHEGADGGSDGSEHSGEEPGSNPGDRTGPEGAHD